MSDRAAAHGITIAIQNHHDIALDTTALLELLSDIDRPNCKLGFDAGPRPAWGIALRRREDGRAAHHHHDHADYIKVPRHHYRPNW